MFKKSKNKNLIKRKKSKSIFYKSLKYVFSVKNDCLVKYKVQTICDGILVCTTNIFNCNSVDLNFTAYMKEIIK